MNDRNVLEGFQIVHQLFKGGLKQKNRVKLLAKLGRVIKKIEVEPKETVVKEPVLPVPPGPPVDARGNIVVGKKFEKVNGTVICHTKGASEVIPQPDK